MQKLSKCNVKEQRKKIIQKIKTHQQENHQQENHQQNKKTQKNIKQKKKCKNTKIEIQKRKK